METPKGQNDKSFLALDQFQFLAVSKCDIMPAQALPTPPPTEPPGRMQNLFTILPFNPSRVKSLRVCQIKDLIRL